MNYANGTQRFAGLLIDILITLPVALLIHYSALGGKPLVSQLLFMLLEGTYYIALWKLKNATLGMMLLKIRITSETGSLSINKLALRYLGLYLSAFCIGLGGFWMMWDKYRQTWQDKIAQTFVIKA